MAKFFAGVGTGLVVATLVGAIISTVTELIASKREVVCSRIVEIKIYEKSLFSFYTRYENHVTLADGRKGRYDSLFLNHVGELNCERLYKVVQ